MGKISILDVTLRDGGIVNDFNFGQRNMRSILSAVEASGIKHIELGYLEKNTGTEQGRTQYCNETVIERFFLKEKKPGVTYLVMMDYGKFDVDALHERTRGSVDAIRLAFHKRNFRDAMPLYDAISAKGYDVYMQPMVTLHYTQQELEELADAANKTKIKGFYFVDTFGQMQQPDIERLTCFFDQRLRPDIALGFHSHNNIQMAYANAIIFLQIPTNRDKMLDSSIMGMGRGAGNLNTELILSHLNQYYHGQYVIPPLLNVMDTVISLIKNQYPWGYSVEYYLSALNDCSPIYANYYYNKHMLPVERLNELLGKLEGEKRISFNKAYAEEKYRDFNGGEPFDDTDTVSILRDAFTGKTVCVIAPGKSISRQKEKVRAAIQTADVTVSLNNSAFDADFELVTRKESYEAALAAQKKVIVPASLARTVKAQTYIIDYYKWITIDEETRDSSGYMIINLLTELGAKKILLTGFDGFAVDPNKNYYEDTLKRALSPEQVENRNKAFRKYIKEKQERFDIRFITDSLYGRSEEQEEVIGMTRKISNLIFDFDGVLIDSIEVQKSAYYGSYQEIVGDDKCPPFSEYMKYTGDSLPNIFKKMGLPAAMAEPYRRISVNAIEKIILNDEAVDLIRELKPLGIKCAICTGKDHYRTIDILKYFGIESLFDAVVCSDDVSEPKPSPIPVLKAIEAMGEGASPDNCMVIGDGLYDIISAKRAGCSSVLTLWYGDEGVERLADFTAATVDDLKGIIEKSIQGQKMKLAQSGGGVL